MERSVNRHYNLFFIYFYFREPFKVSFHYFYRIHFCHNGCLFHIYNDSLHYRFCFLFCDIIFNIKAAILRFGRKPGGY